MKKLLDKCIDLTRMECKASGCQRDQWQGKGIDLTRMECKVFL